MRHGAPKTTSSRTGGRFRGVGGLGSRGLGLLLLLGAIALSALPSCADEPDARDAAPIPVPVEPPLPAAVREDPRMRALWTTASTEAEPDPAPLWSLRDPRLQRELDAALGALGLDEVVRDGDLAIAFVDLRDRSAARVAEVNGDRMLYAASLPKLAVMLAAFESSARGDLALDEATLEQLRLMIQRSSNPAATAMMHRVGKPSIAYTLLSPRYRLYDPARGGGLWVGKDYAQGGLWRRDPLHDLSHGATAMQVARFYYMLESGRLVSPEDSERMMRLLSSSEMRHKFAAALADVNPRAEVYRKSGTWRSFHADSALVRRDGRGYIAVALCDDPRGKEWLGQIVARLDEIIFPGDS